MAYTLVVLIVAATLEVGGDALVRVGLHGRYGSLAVGALTLAVYGIVVNQGRPDFGRLMGAYIAVFFAVSQLIAFGMFRVTPDLKTALGGSLILIGGAVLML